ncbi:glycine cleavage system aminomethyltransferase GcvT [Leisingera daeponensis]|uniref:glycine cleavage system aminomethyltransferase GcvT n=1 Tax=Leisingera daeponensis TaxID=405746 RepID=UPI001C952A92|nr:glycine cleavage system aminomethyltransferase GcvT [Leisingera daeponensis]MBY6059600.1 glycine cleavage system aminomethyltransferase GcvT [Leisingera daeponensis]
MAETQQTPFHTVGEKMGAQMIELFGYFLPWQYSPGAKAEHIATREEASLCDLHYMAEFAVDGPDAMKFVQMIATANISKLQPGSVKYSCFCNHEGKMIDDGTIWCFGLNSLMLITGDEADGSWFDEVAKGFDVNIKNVTNSHTTLALQGPNSRKILEQATSAPIHEINYYKFVKGDVAGVPCVIARMGYTGEYGFELHFESGSAKKVWDEIFHAGQDYGLVPLGQSGLESLRQEAGYVLVGNEHDKQTNPLEAGLGWTIDFNKADFIGKTALENIQKQGIGRTLVWFDVLDGTEMNKGDFVVVGEKEIGRVTSGSYSPGRKKGTALAYVSPEYAINGAVYTLKNKDGEHSAKLSVAPLFDPGNVRSRTFVR